MLDFETAGQGKINPCEIGLAFVENGKIVGTKRWLIKPPCYPRFEPSFTNIHGISAMDVANSPEFPGVWREVQPLIEGKFVLAHYATFDMDVLYQTLCYYGLALPNFTYGCTCQFSRIIFQGEQSHGLAALCQTHKIKFQHHRASEDARAAAELALIMFEKRGIHSIGDIEDNLAIRLGRMMTNGKWYQPYKPSKSKQKAKTPRKSSKPKEKQSEYVHEIASGVYRYDSVGTNPIQEIHWQQQSEAEVQRKLKEERWQKEQERLIEERQKKKEQEEYQHWVRQQEEIKRLHEKQQEEARQEQERKDETKRKRKEEWQRRRQAVTDFVHEHENLVVVAIVGVFALLLVLGFVGLHYAAERVQENRRKEQERIVAMELWREEQARLAEEEREREEQRQREEEQRQRLIAEQRQREEEEERERQEREARGCGCCSGGVVAMAAVMSYPVYTFFFFGGLLQCCSATDSSFQQRPLYGPDHLRRVHGHAALPALSSTNDNTARLVMRLLNG